MISNLYDIFNEYSYNKIDELKNDEEFLSSVSEEISEEMRTVS